MQQGWFICDAWVGFRTKQGLFLLCSSNSLQYILRFFYLPDLANSEQIAQSLLRGDRVADYVLKPARISYTLQENPGAYSDRLTCILGRLSHLQADIHEKMMHDSEICDQAESILKELWDWNTDRQQSLDSSNLSLPKGYDIFSSHTMNQYRAARLSINQICQRTLRRDFARTLKDWAAIFVPLSQILPAMRMSYFFSGP